MRPSSAAPSPALLEALQKPAPSTVQVETVDFKALGFADQEEAFAILIHGLFTPEECDALLDGARGATGDQWDPALINAGGHDVLATDVRLCDRIVWDAPSVGDAVLQRIVPHLPADIVTLQDRPMVTSHDPHWAGRTWRLARLNERLRFLRYAPGMYFREHMDANFEAGGEVSFLTVHLYLRSSPDLAGGATRFFGEDNRFEPVEWDVHPTMGTVLVFQQFDMEHSGEDVWKGTKYTMRTDVMYQRVPRIMRWDQSHP